jgi:hypothetical protein
MATDATGAPTPLGIPKYNTSVDAPSGLGFNATMDALDALITAKGLPSATGTNKIPVWTGSSWVSKTVGLSFFTGAAPPGSPNDGDLWLLPADATNGVQWLFRYNAGSASASKWEFIGGPPLVSEVDADETFTGDATYHDAGTIGPLVTVPRAGDYDYLMAAGIYNTGFASDQFLGLAKNGAVATPDQTAVFATAAGVTPSASKNGRLTGLAASDVLKMQYKGNNAGQHVRWRALNVTPVRVS